MMVCKTCTKSINGILIITVEDFEQGIPQLAAVLNKSFGLYRVFFAQANRILLRRIAKLSKLEKDQRELDKKDAAQPDKCKLYTFEGEDDKERARLERIIEIEINELCTIKSAL